MASGSAVASQALGAVYSAVADQMSDSGVASQMPDAPDSAVAGQESAAPEPSGPAAAMDGPRAEMRQKDDAAACAAAWQEENVAKLKQGMYCHKTLSTSAMVTAEDQPETLSKDDKSHTMPREAMIAQPAETPKEEVLSGIWNHFEELLAAETQ